MESEIRLLAFNGSPRIGGNTATMLRAMVEGAREAGAVCEVVNVCDLEIAPCIGCGACDNTGICIIEDDMQEIYQKIVDAQRLVLASPIYFYGITAQAKALVDRTQALWNRWRLDGAPERKGEDGRRGVLLAVAATKGPKVFDGAILTAKYAFDAMGFAHGGELLWRGLENTGDAAGNIEALDAARAEGRALVQAITPPGQ